MSPSVYLKSEQRESLLALLADSTPSDAAELCKLCFSYLTAPAPLRTPNVKRCESLSQQHTSDGDILRTAMEALMALLIDASSSASGEVDVRSLLLQREGSESATFGRRVSPEVLDVLTQFVSSKRCFIEGSIKSANIRAHRLVNLEWRLEVRVASRSLLRQSNVCVTMKLYLHTEPKNENRDLLLADVEDVAGDQQANAKIHPDEQRNRKDLLVQTDLSSLLHIIQSLEDALVESRSRRIRNIVDAIH